MRFSLICTALAGLLLPAVASAGRPAFGCEAGLSVSRFSFEEAQNLPIPEDRYGSSTWIRGGVRARLPIGSGFAMVGGVSYEAGGESVDLRGVRVFSLQVVENGMATQRLEYLSLPLMVEYAIPGESGGGWTQQVKGSIGLQLTSPAVTPLGTSGAPRPAPRVRR